MSSKQRVQPQITFDEFNRLRILDTEHAKHTESLAEDSKVFIDSQHNTHPHHTKHANRRTTHSCSTLMRHPGYVLVS